MGSPAADNTSANFLNTIISAFMSGGETAAETAITAADPELFGNPVMQFFLDEGVQWLGQIISIAGQKFVDNVVIDLQANGEESGVMVAGTALALANASGDTNAISKAVADASAAYKAAFNFDGIATPK